MAKSPGRPTKFSPDIIRKAEKLAMLGLTDKQMAAALDICERTLNGWKKEHPEFLQSLKAGKDMADAEVAASLFQRACGYSHKAVKMFVAGGKVIAQEYIEHYPPDTVACIFWLKNRQPELWREKPQPVDGDDDLPESRSFTYNVVDGRFKDEDDGN